MQVLRVNYRDTNASAAFLHPRNDIVLSDRYTAREYLDERLEEIGLTS